ncbi:DUF1835 domain-containing protein [Pedobacter sp. LMG 31464]|uniref:DUF1835 domain-containing protein n=1 Tax=Pedobacter planticolens TaxID=2679964 RepID=A0A923IWC6_9SPHI|nr:DUF1835 domain-containing protein [Pedobacter planticolens]MBB2146039.1 DUF1835 domain-containing protein [Pedobacter planticolens]
MKTLHILNGDATLYVFNRTKIEGDILVWREILADGPVSKTNLWELRSDWICKTFGENSTNYQQKVITEAEKLNNIDKYDEVVLWFEYDLTCQINLICILSSINSNYNEDTSISLICPESIEVMPNFRGLGELNPTQLSELLHQKVKLQKADLAFAAEAWDLYIENDFEKIQAFLIRDFGNLPLLKKALKAHLLRFPNRSTQLNHIEEVLLGFINSGISSKAELYDAFWTQESIYGLTDLQLDHILNQLKEKELIAKGLF